MLVFKNPDVAAKYESSFKSDPIVHMPGSINGNGWRGKLSTIPLLQADRLHDVMKSNLLRLKTAAAPADKRDTNKVKSSDKENVAGNP